MIVLGDYLDDAGAYTNDTLDEEGSVLLPEPNLEFAYIGCVHLACAHYLIDAHTVRREFLNCTLQRDPSSPDIPLSHHRHSYSVRSSVIDPCHD